MREAHGGEAGGPALTRWRARPRWDLVLATVAVVAGAALRLAPHPGGFWLDELYTAYATDPEMPFTAAFTTRMAPDFQPPLYYPLMWACHALVGTGEAASRAFGGGVGVAALVGCAGALRGAVPRPAACAAVGVLALAFAAIGFAHEARAYALLYALSAAGYALVVRSLACRRTPACSAGLLGVALVAGGVHYYGMLLGCALLLARAAGHLARAERRTALVDLGLSATLAGVFVGVLLWQWPRLDMASPGVGWLRNDWGRLALEYRHLLARNDLALAALALLGVAALAGRLARPLQAALLTGFVVSVAVPVLLTLHTPLLVARYLIVSVPPLLLWAALRAADPGGRWRGATLAVVLSALLAADLQALPRIRKEEWRAGAHMVAVHDRPGCPVPVWNWWPGVYAHYLPGTMRSRLTAVARSGPLAPLPAGCRVLLWAGHPNRLTLTPPPGTRVVRLYGQVIWLAPQAARPQARAISS